MITRLGEEPIGMVATAFIALQLTAVMARRIAPFPRFVVFFRHGGERLQISVKVGDYDDHHQATFQLVSGFTLMLRNSILLSW